MEKLNKIGLPVVLLVMFTIIGIMKSAVNIGYGEAGVLFRTFGEGTVVDEPPLGEGFHIIAPWNSVYLYNVKQQEVFESQMQVLSSNGLEISLDVSVLYQPVASELGLLHKTKGSNYLDIVIVPSIRAVARSVVGRYTPEQLYSTKRDAIQSEIYDELKDGVESQHVQINAVLVRDVTLPQTIKQAIERKLSQEQQSLEYEFRLESARKEAEKVRIDAKGKADANRILNSSLTTNILRDKGIEATVKLSESANSKVIVIGSGKDGLPIILGNQ
jgi:regulator of protease activity HflC (stomatin/prohibitin superfamily)